MTEEKTPEEIRLAELRAQLDAVAGNPISEMEYVGKVTAALKKIRDSGRQPTKEEILTIKIHARSGEEEPLEPSKVDKIAERVTDLCDVNTRRGLELIARNMGFEPTKTEYPDKLSLATAIAEKELPEKEAETA